jgi:hypothetical protein
MEAIVPEKSGWKKGRGSFLRRAGKGLKKADQQ